MKKAIVIVSAIGLLLSVNFAFARPPIPVRVNETISPIIQYILDWLTDLQQQVNNIELLPGPQGEQGPVGPAGPALYLYDQNNQNLGYIIEFFDRKGNNYGTFLPDSYTILTFERTPSGNILLGPYASQVFYTELNCQGTPYLHDNGFPPGAVVSGPNGSPNRLFRYIGGSISHEPVLSVLELGVCINQSFGSGVYPLEEISMPLSLPILGPLEIRTE